MQDSEGQKTVISCTRINAKS